MWHENAKNKSSMINLERQIFADYNKRGIDSALSYITQQANAHQRLVGAEANAGDQFGNNIIVRRLINQSTDEFYLLKVIEEDESSQDELDIMEQIARSNK